jgi:hypothetical protein
MMALRDYNAMVEFVDRNVAEGRGDKTAFVDPSRNPTYGELRASVPRQGGIFRSIIKLEPARPLPGDRAPMWGAAAYLEFCVIWRWAC